MGEMDEEMPVKPTMLQRRERRESKSECVAKERGRKSSEE
jgi:hypothetical protein